MSLLRDPKIVKIIAESLNIEQINDEACRTILSDLEQKLRLVINVGQIINHIKSGGVGLFVCGGYQLLGKYYRPYKGKDIKGLDIFDLHTRHFGLDKKRLVGNVTIDIEGIEFLKGKKLVGFENHGGRTYLEQNINMLGKIKTGSGNNNEDSTEGAVMHNCIGTYLHGPLLSKNPHLADYLIMTALERRYKKEVDLEPLDDDLEWETHKNAIKLHQ